MSVERYVQYDTWMDDGKFVRTSNIRSESSVTATEYRFNELGLGLLTGRIKPEQYAAGAAAGARNTITYDDQRLHQASVTNELGHVVYTDYDLGTGALLSTRGPNTVACGTGCTEYEEVRTEIDGFGRPLRVYATTDDADGTYREEMIQRFTYFDFESPQRVREERFIDWGGIDAVTTDTWYDGFGRVLERKQYRFDGSPDSVERFGYDAQGNLAFATVPNPSADDGSTVTYTYRFDALNRPTRIDRPDPGAQGNASAITWTYDGLATTRREVAPDGGPHATTTTTKDIWGRLVKVDEYLEDPPEGEPVIASTTYEYDANDNLKKATNPDGIVTEIEHDWMSRRKTITRGARVWQYGYDRNSNLTTEIAPYPAGADPLFYTTTVAYDVLDRPDSRIGGIRDLTGQELDELGHGLIDFIHDQASNGIGRLAVVTSPIFERRVEYDARGNRRAERVSFHLDGALGIGAAGQIVNERTYNALGAVTEELHGDESHTTTSYDRRGLPTTLTWGTTTPLLLADLERNGAGLPVANVPSSDTGYYRFWEYDQLGRVTVSAAGAMVGGVKQSPRILENLTYYDTDDPMTLTASRAGLAGHLFTYSYDDRHQLVSAFDDHGYDASFVYTPAGRLDAAQVVAPGGAPLAPPRDVTYAYAGLDPEAVTELTSNIGAPPTIYEHDVSGNVTSRDEDGPGTEQPFTFKYDGEDQQRIATAPNGDQELYYYDEGGQRILAVSRQPGGTVTKVRFWAGSTEIEYDATGDIQKTLAHLSLGGIPIARIEDLVNVKRVVHGQLGHMLGALSFDGSVLDAAFVYGPFGEILAQTGAAPDYLRRFNGKEHDQLTDLYYYGFRYFDPLSLTWTQADPLYRFVPDLAWDEPRRMNLYSFSANNPLRYLDPDGRDWKDRLWGGIKVLGGAAIAVGGCGVSLGFGCAVAVAAGGVVAGEGAHEVLTGEDQPNAVEAYAGETAGQAFNAAVTVGSLVSLGRSVAGMVGALRNPLGLSDDVATTGAKVQQRAGHNGVAGPAQQTTRLSRKPGHEKSITIKYPDGSKKDISRVRVKETVPETHPKAPAGTPRKVKFDESEAINTERTKRLPTSEELEALQ